MRMQCGADVLMSPSPADEGLTSPWAPWLSLLSLSSPRLRDVWHHWHDTWHMHRSQISTLAVILTQIRPDCPCWSDYRAPYLLDQLMGWMSGDCMHPLQSATVTCSCYHFPDKMYCSGPRLRRPFGIIITADLARAHNYTSHPGARPRCISH